MDREFLESLGLEKDTIDKVMQAYGKTINPLKSERDLLKANEGQLKSERDDYSQQLEDLKKNNKDNKALQDQIDQIKADKDKAIGEYEDQLKAQEFDFRLENRLKDMKVRNTKAFKALLEIDSLSLDGEKIKGLNEQVDALKETDSYLFEDEGKKGNFSQGSHSNGGSKPSVTKDDFRKMGYAERMKLKEENPDVYKELRG